MITAISDAILPKKGKVQHWTGLEGAARAFAIARAARAANGTVLVITTGNEESNKIASELRFFGDKELSIHVFPDTETLPYDKESPHSEAISTRAGAIHALNTQKENICSILVTPIQSALRLLPCRTHWLGGMTLIDGDAIDRDMISETLVNMGYVRCDTVSTMGEFCFNNDVFDVFPFGGTHAFRTNILNGKVTALKSLSVSRQTSGSVIPSATMLPGREYTITSDTIRDFLKKWRDYFGPESTQSPLYREVRDSAKVTGLEFYNPLLTDTATILDLIPSCVSVFVLDGVAEAAKKYEDTINGRYSEISLIKKEFAMHPSDLWLDYEALTGLIKQSGVTFLNSTGHGVDFGSLPTDFERKESVDVAVDMLKPWVAKVKKVVYCMSSDARREEMDFICDMLEQVPAWITHWSEADVNQVESAIALANIEKGFYLPSADLLLITEREIFGQPIFQKHDMEDAESIDFTRYKDLQGLKIGDPVVHLQYGVGRFDGLVAMDYFDIKKEYVTIRYASDAKIYVKMEDLDYVSRYSGINQEKAPLDIAGSDKWLKGLKNSFSDIKATAESLLKIHAEKEVKIGISMGDTDHRYEKFCSEFPFQETKDQIAATHDIIVDLQSSRPMDRIVCGDVGFGKTEVAMRAVFHAVASGYQVAVMVPSTILAQQHYQTFKQRFASFPFKIECMTRFAKQSEEAIVLKDLVAGRVDIVIGTHRIIQSDVRYRKLGLLVIDEEHRFGVKQKEQLRKMRSDMNVLSMTATPIPRTLSMSMHGIRDLSVIATPPAKRLSIRTFVQELNDELIREAISRESLRSGQVFYVHNSIETIELAAERIRSLFPELRVCVAHAQMSEMQLERIMAAFYGREFDVLVCTTIIETGIDVPNANTIIIESANRFGLAQLHQLRGRVGRSTRQAYAYLCADRIGLSAEAEKRLKAMADANSLGEGFMLANHDLEIRGAGEVLGEKQSGHIQAIGFQLYMRLLDRAIEILKSGRNITGDFKDQLHVDVDMGCSGLIPNDYVKNESIRLSFYKRIASVETMDALERIKNELSDRFGSIPEYLANHIKIASVKFGLAALGVAKVSMSDKSGYLMFDSDVPVGQEQIACLSRIKGAKFYSSGPSKIGLDSNTISLTEKMELVTEIRKQLERC